MSDHHEDAPQAPGFPLADRDAAMAVRRAVLGDDHVDAAVAGTTTQNAPFQDLATSVAWGGLWSRDGLDRPSRSLVTIAILAALGREAELRMHLRAAVARTGVPPEGLVEVLLHVAVYAGLPAANEGFRLLSEVTAELDADDPDGAQDGNPDRDPGEDSDGAQDGSEATA